MKAETDTALTHSPNYVDCDANRVQESDLLAWPRSSLKRHGILLGGSGFPVDEQGFSETEMEIPFFKVKDLAGPLEIRATNNYISKETAARLGATIFPNSTLVFAKVGAALLLNRFRVLCCEGCLDNNMMALLLKKPNHVAFFLHLLNNSDLASNFNQGPVPSVNTRQVGALAVTVPPPSEQTRIAAYLDASCAAIDGAIAAKQRQLETLDAVRDSIVTLAVTNGLNPKAKMKVSGVDWLSEVPAHWKMQQIKRVCCLVRGQFTHRPRNDPALYDGPYPFVQTGDITAAGKYIRTYSQTLNEIGLSVSKRFPRGTLVMSIAANIGDVAILDFEACFPDSMIGMIPSCKINLDFLYYLMRAMRGIMLRSAVQSTQLNLNYVRIGTNFAPIPPLDEQVAIAAYLDEKERDLFLISKGIKSQIATLTAYRKSLIHECVTGQRRISEADVQQLKITVDKGESPVGKYRHVST